MAYHRELLQQAIEVLAKSSPSQADLRRAVSTSYYALFHLLIAETVLHWDVESSRGALGRMFEHTQMRRISKRVADSKQHPYLGEDAAVVVMLRQVAQAFLRLQDARHVADYDNSVIWSHSDAQNEVEQALAAFALWRTISHEKIAQGFLVSLLIKSRD